jgi:hypothetical protein
MGRVRNSLPLQGATSLASEDRTQAMCMHIETPAKPQTSDSLFPISASHNWQCQKWNGVKSKVKVKSNGNAKTINTDGLSFSISSCLSLSLTLLLTYPV